MGLWGAQVVPRMVDLVCRQGSADELRARTCAGLSGDVVEIGFGSGLNVPHYPAAVRRVVAVEPSDVAWRLAAPRVARAAVPVERAGLDAQRLPLPDAAFDSALSTWTLCTVPDPLAALAELRRVLRPGGALHFVEHGIAPDASVQRWQARLEPVQKRVAGGCHLTRDAHGLLVAAGFEVRAVDRFYERGAPKVLGAAWLGTAAAPAASAP